MGTSSPAAGYRGQVVYPPDEHLRLEEAFRKCPGEWVAIDRKTGRIVAAKDSPYELSGYVKERGIRGVDIIRAPAENESEVVGFG